MKYFAIALINSVVVICFTILAVTFDRWWIVLFALLLSMSERSNKDE